MLRKFVFQIVTGASLGHFYFIPILAFCFLLLPILSRLTEICFWQVRDPVLQFHVGYFVLGVLAARYRRELGDAFVRHASTIGLAAGIGIIGFACLAAARSPWAAHPLVRIAYTPAVVGLIMALTPHRPAPAVVRSPVRVSASARSWSSSAAACSESIPCRSRKPDAHSAISWRWDPFLSPSWPARLPPHVDGHGSTALASSAKTLLAATASVHRMTLVTRNKADVARPGAKVLNPFHAHATGR